MAELNLPPQAEAALNRLQDTTLTPMEEALFKAWTKANQIQDPDNPKDIVDYRGIYKASGGTILPAGELARRAEMHNKQYELEQALHQRMMERINEVTTKEQDRAEMAHKEERQDVTHKQKMDMESLKQKNAPHDLKMKEHDVKAKQLDIHKQQVGLDAQKLGNEGKKIDLMASLVAPKKPTEPTGGSSANK